MRAASGVPFIGGKHPASEMFCLFELLYHGETWRGLTAATKMTILIEAQIFVRKVEPPRRQDAKNSSQSMYAYVFLASAM